MQNDAHFPLLVFTDNPSARSKEADALRETQYVGAAAVATYRASWRMRQAGRDTPALLQEGEDYALGQMQSPVSICDSRASCDRGRGR